MPSSRRRDVPQEAVPPLDLRAVDDLEASLAADLQCLRKSYWIGAHVVLLGLLLEIDTGRVRPVEVVVPDD